MLVTPRHVVRRQWNSAVLDNAAQRTGAQVFEIPCVDTVRKRPLNMRERFAVACRRESDKKMSGESGKLDEVVEVALDAKVMVTMNIQTDLDVANGTRDTVCGVVLHEDEPPNSADRRVRLVHQPEYLVRLDNTRMPALQGLPQGVVPRRRGSRSLSVGGKTKTVHRTQHPITLAYAFTDIRSQGQTIPRVVLDLA